MVQIIHLLQTLHIFNMMSLKLEYLERFRVVKNSGTPCYREDILNAFIASVWFLVFARLTTKRLY